MWQEVRPAWWTGVSPRPSLGKLSVAGQVGRQPVPRTQAGIPPALQMQGCICMSLQDQRQQWVLGFCGLGADWVSQEPAGGVPPENHMGHCTHMPFPDPRTSSFQSLGSERAPISACCQMREAGQPFRPAPGRRRGDLQPPEPTSLEGSGAGLPGWRGRPGVTKTPLTL